MISVIICTHNRPDKLKDCLKSILVSSFSDFEIIVIDQSNGNQTKKAVSSFSNHLIEYQKMDVKGLSKGRNLGIEKSRGDIVAFTDDDCLVDIDWLKNILSNFQENKHFLVVFGKVLPHKPEEHVGLISPGVSKHHRNTREILSSISYDLFDFGIGNNMAFKRSVFEKIGEFKEWLGVGSLGCAGEEGEIIYRLLKEKIGKNKILFNPDVIVYHNRWISKNEYVKQRFAYNYGTAMVLLYYYFLGDRANKKYLIRIFKDKLKQRWQEIKFSLLGLHPILFIKITIEVFNHCIRYLRGILIALYLTKLGRIKSNQ